MEILGQLVNTLRTNERYLLLKRDNLMIPIHTQLSRKQNTFPQFFKGFSKSRLNFKYFEKKDDTRTFCISTCQILRLLVNTFPIDENYPLLKRDNLTIPIKVQLSQKQKTFSLIFA